MTSSPKASELFLSLGLVTTLSLTMGACGTANPTSTEPMLSGSPVSVIDEGGEGGEGGESAGSTSLQWGKKLKDGRIISEFTDNVVLPKYREYSQNAGMLAVALSTLNKNPDESSLKLAREAWTNTRMSWEQTETFTFGPAGSLGFDGAMDSWPINETDIQKILASGTPLTPDRIAQLQDSERGMHTLEFLLFGSKNDKTLAQLTDRERQYLESLGQHLSTTATALLVSWEKGVDGQPAYRDVFGKAGSANNSTYSTVEAGVQEMVTGILHSLEEVGTEKLGGPFKEKDPAGLESRFSFQTMNDLTSNLQSAENAYLGSYPKAQTSSQATLSAYIAQNNPSLDTTIKQQFQTAKTLLVAIPTPLETSLTDPKAAPAIEAAQAAVLNLHKTFQDQVVPLI
jgi:putative iron-regulated protein